jgi:hypothetical protein
LSLRDWGTPSRPVIYYVEVGDQATALAVFDNMIAMGCE